MIFDTDQIRDALLREIEKGQTGELPDSIREVARRIGGRYAFVREALRAHEAGTVPMARVVEAIFQTQGAIAECLSVDAIRFVILAEGLRAAHFLKGAFGERSE